MPTDYNQTDSGFCQSLVSPWASHFKSLSLLTLIWVISIAKSWWSVTGKQVLDWKLEGFLFSADCATNLVDDLGQSFPLLGPLFPHLFFEGIGPNETYRTFPLWESPVLHLDSLHVHTLIPDSQLPRCQAHVRISRGTWAILSLSQMPFKSTQYIIHSLIYAGTLLCMGLERCLQPTKKSGSSVVCGSEFNPLNLHNYFSWNLLVKSKCSSLCPSSQWTLSLPLTHYGNSQPMASPLASVSCPSWWITRPYDPQVESSKTQSSTLSNLWALTQCDILYEDIAIEMT